MEDGGNMLFLELMCVLNMVIFKLNFVIIMVLYRYSTLMGATLVVNIWTR